ncbi:MAG: ferritin [Bacteroidota bacterium]|nr:ferritin [Candidatus Kapabacteria bacterium]MCX7937532.1 ferritin [Chlorobiota bacterium]MDW8074842.1 ferritin [Bacteroidota bacterium]MDW8271481.1 ferritin [Bacteroidota bacterium]
MKATVLQAVQAQIQAELESAYLYFALGLVCRDRGLPGIAHWLTVQHDEEREHAMKFIEHAHARGQSVRLEDIRIKRVEWNTVGDLFRAVLEHEQYISGRIHALYELAHQEKDYPILPLLEWFIMEQVEEEETVRTILDKIAMVGESGSSLYLLDQELGKRSA